MITVAKIQEWCEQIVSVFHPHRIILFGSHAFGVPTPDSDIDLLIIMPFKGRHTKQAIRILNNLNVLAPIELLVRTPEQVKKRLAMGDTFLREILERGKVMYESNHPRMDRQS